MDTQIVVESFPLLGVCNLCLNFCAVKSMLTAYKHEGTDEMYSEMLIKCYSIDISQMQLGDTKPFVCDSCIISLRQCCKFRDQVEASLKTLEVTAVMSQKAEGSEGNQVKREVTPVCYELHDAPDFDDEDDLFLKEISVKKEPQENPKPKKSITIKFKKNKTKEKYAETEKMLKSGLFPFKERSKNVFRCAICTEKSIHLEVVKNHVIQHKINNIHVAFVKMAFSNTQRFFKHDDHLRCKICTIDIKNFEELKNHVENCSRIPNASWGNLPFKLEKDQLDCPVCKKTFLNFVNLNTHMNTHYPNFICENCGKAFASKARLRGHIRTHEIGNFACKYCDMVFDRVTKRENHVSKQHKAGLAYACKRCKISLPSFYARQKHLAEVHNEELKRYKCKVCPQSYITPGHLSSHVRRDHLNERNHKCTKCELAFYTKNALNMHMIKHDGERIHICNICQKSYQRKKTLREHLRIHNNDKRFVCPVCGRAFTQKCTLKGHLKVHERKVEFDDGIVPVSINCRDIL